MWDTAVVAFATLFATIGPLDVGVVFASLTGTMPTRERRRTALRGVAIAAAILLGFAVFGRAMLDTFGISLAALRIGGGILLLLIAIDLVFARPSGASTTTSEELAEASSRPDIATFPLATPLLAGPGAMGAVVLLMAERAGHVAEQAMVVAAILAVLGVGLACMLLAGHILRLLGRTGVHVIARVMGVLLAGLAVQFMLDGLEQTPLFGRL
ncbi:MAG: MarC family protein [Pseudomonadota bacterium]|nr:MarC family protein [Pseudomonadota bacterium]